MQILQGNYFKNHIHTCTFKLIGDSIRMTDGYHMSIYQSRVKDNMSNMIYLR